MKVAQFPVLFLSIALSAYGQFDAEQFARDLRSKLGEPLPRQTFVARTGIEVTVDYAANGRVCRISLPPVATERPGVMSPKAVDDFVLELVPLSLRGKDLGKLKSTFSLLSISSSRYENVTISEAWSEPR